MFKKLSVLAASLLAVGVVQADVTPGSYSIGVGGGYYHFASPAHLDSVAGIPFVNFGYNVNKTWGLRLQVGHVNTNETNNAKQSVNGYIINTDAVYRFSKVHKISPYMTVGLGISHLKYNRTGNHMSRGNGNIGVGMQYFIAPSIAIDLHAQDLYTFSTKANDYMIGGGFDFLFGGSNSQMLKGGYGNYDLPPSNGSLAQFELNSAKVNGAYKAKIQKLAKTMLANPGSTVTLRGYADDTGTEKYNTFLSQKRANSVAHYLMKDGVKKGAITVVALGESSPLASNKTPSGRAENRRVEADVNLG